MPLDRTKQALLDHAVQLLSSVAGVQALALGGSYARGFEHPDSDLDLAIYYREAHPPDIDGIRRIAAEIYGSGDTDVTGLYGWGPWVNGGAWILTPAGKVDFIYRNLDQVERVILAAQEGEVQHDYYQQPPYGFFSVTYLAETRICRPLFDPHDQLAAAKQLVAGYPPRLKERIITGSLWQAEFALFHARSFAGQGNIYAASGTMSRVAVFLVQALFALNEIYYFSDKTALQEITGFALAPPEFRERLTAALSGTSLEDSGLSVAVSEMTELWRSVVALYPA